jgi:hypothetical protein
MVEGQQKINGAYRLHLILKNAVSHPPSTNQMQVWIHAFGLLDLSGRKQKIQIAYGMKLLFDELDDIVAYLQEIGHPENAYHHLIELIEQSITPEGIVQQWQDSRIRLNQAEAILLILSNFLPDRENIIPEDDLSAIRAELEQLEKSLEDKDISPIIRLYIQRQMKLIREALWEYRIRGVQVFYEAEIKAYLLSEAPEIKEQRDAPPVRKVSQVWQRINKIIDITIKAKSFLEAGVKILQLAQDAWHHVS